MRTSLWLVAFSIVSTFGELTGLPAFVLIVAFALALVGDVFELRAQSRQDRADGW
jgi:hypothetical protein